MQQADREGAGNGKAATVAQRALMRHAGYVIPAGTTADSLFDDAQEFLSCAVEVLQGAISALEGNGQTEVCCQLHGALRLGRIAEGTLSAALDARHAAPA